MGTRIYRYEGQRYTDETLHTAPPEFLALLRKRGVAVPAVQAEDAPALTDIDGVGKDLANTLRAAGYGTVADVAGAEPRDLQQVSGIGPRTAHPLKAAAQVVLAGSPQTGGPLTGIDEEE